MFVAKKAITTLLFVLSLVLMHRSQLLGEVSLWLASRCQCKSSCFQHFVYASGCVSK